MREGRSQSHKRDKNVSIEVIIGIINSIILLTLSNASEIGMECNTAITNKCSGNTLHMKCLQCQDGTQDWNEDGLSLACVEQQRKWTVEWVNG